MAIDGNVQWQGGDRTGVGEVAVSRPQRVDLVRGGMLVASKALDIRWRRVNALRCGIWPHVGLRWPLETSKLLDWRRVIALETGDMMPS